MELSSKSKLIKKRSRKKKICLPENVILPSVQPFAIDGISNWLLMQKIIGPVKQDKSGKTVEKKMSKSTGSNQIFKDSKSSFRGKSSLKKKNASESPRLCAKSEQKDVKEFLNDNSPIEVKASETAIRNQCVSFKFNFDESSNNPNNVSDEEMDKDKYAEKKLTKAVAMDCEMVGTGPSGEESILARVSIVNSFGVCLYDEFVKPKEKVTDFRTHVSGVRPSDLKKGKDLFEVQKDVCNIIEGRILVGHAIRHDLDVLFLSHPRHLIRDTAHYKPFKELCGGRTPSLKKLTSKILSCEIQSGEHSSIEDAQAAMLLYLTVKKEWEKKARSHRKREPKLIENHTLN